MSGTLTKIIRIIFKVDGKSASKGASELDKTLANLKKTVLAAGASFLSLKTAQAVYDLGVLGAEAERLENAFENVSGGAYRAKQNFEAIQRASRGTLSQTEALRTGLRFMQMGLANNADELGNLTELATRLGTAMGYTAEQSIQSFSVMLTNMSVRRLDNFGISVANVYKRMRELAKAFPHLSREERFMRATLEEGKKALERLGSVAGDNRTATEQLAAAWKDAKIELGRSFTPILRDVARGLTYLLRKMNDASAGMRDLQERFGEEAVQAAVMRDAYSGVAEAYGYTTQAATEAAQATETLNNSAPNAKTLDQWARGYYVVSAATETVGEAASDAAPSVADLEAKLRAENAATARWTELADYYVEKTREAAQANEDFEATSAMLAGVMGDSADALHAAGVQGAKYAAAQEAMLIITGQLTPEELQHKKQLAAIAQAYADDAIDAFEYAKRVRELEQAWGNIPETVHTTYYIETQGTMPGLVSPAGTNERIRFASGGYVSSAGHVIVGENGPEAIYLPRGAYINRSVSSTTNVNKSITVNVASDLDAALAALLIDEPVAV